MILNAPGSDKMKEARMATPCPDWSTFVEICCAILAAMDITSREKLKLIQRDLQSMWEGMTNSVTYCKGKRNLVRNIFFVATGTGELCLVCHQFDLETTGHHHKDICYKSTPAVRDTDEGSNMRTRSDGKLECNSCLKTAKDDKVTVGQFKADHKPHDHKKAELMLSGHFTYATERPNMKPPIKKPRNFEGWARLEETIKQKAPHASKIAKPDKLSKFYVVCAAVSFADMCKSMMAPSPYKSEVLHECIEKIIKNMHEKAYNGRKAKGCFDFSVIVSILYQTAEIQAKVNKQIAASQELTPEKIKELQKLQTLLKNNKDSIEKDPGMFGFQTPQKDKHGEVSQFTIGDMKNPQDSKSQVSAAKTTPGATASIETMLASFDTPTF